MSTCSWAIKGFGFDLSNLEIDYFKVLETLNSDWLKDAFSDEEFTLDEYKDYLEGVKNKVSEYIDATGEELFRETLEHCECVKLFGEGLILDFVSDGGDKSYLFYPALMPWEIEDGVKNMSRDEMIDALVDIVHPFTKQTKEELVEIINEINTYGQG